MGRKGIVLVVEDDPLIMQLLGDFLHLEGYEVLFAPDGEFALKELEKKIPDLVLLDLHLPGKSGFEILEIIRGDERWKKIKVIALTAAVHTEAVKKIKESDFDGAIYKPLSMKDLKKLVRETIPA